MAQLRLEDGISCEETAVVQELLFRQETKYFRRSEMLVLSPWSVSAQIYVNAVNTSQEQVQFSNDIAT